MFKSTATLIGHTFPASFARLEPWSMPATTFDCKIPERTINGKNKMATHVRIGPTMKAMRTAVPRFDSACTTILNAVPVACRNTILRLKGQTRSQTKCFIFTFLGEMTFFHDKDLQSIRPWHVSTSANDLLSKLSYRVHLN